MVGFLPGYISSRDAPTSEDLASIERHQQEVELKLAVLAAQNTRIVKTLDEARKRIIALQTRKSPP